MKASATAWIAALALGLTAASAHADDIEGNIESIDKEAMSLVVDGKSFSTNEQTEYEDELKSFSDLQQGMRVEVDYEETNGEMIATEIEVDD
ncbi:DUF1344 domain-containing protein [Pseudomonas sp. gcc21]|uniref:DUF5666 domain-containing protein n=1 Tax=Pseudomonas sp. gcc21 TaxID=2726989 RepID=UPI001451A29D|nr:DUF5666 domain-containing protein [Pseudomonas sp. gcc21]QJD57930.1 DUF1344 domain-containing protein [Pseudomonas sp. gcc21]